MNLVDTRDDTDRTLLMVACSEGASKTVESLLNIARRVPTVGEVKAYVNSSDIHGLTALMEACIYYDGVNMIDELINHNAELDLQDEDGFSALMHASIKGHAENVLALLESGAGVNLKNRYGNTAYDVATDEDTVKVFEDFFERGKEDEPS